MDSRNAHTYKQARTAGRIGVSGDRSIAPHDRSRTAIAILFPRLRLTFANNCGTVFCVAQNHVSSVIFTLPFSFPRTQVLLCTYFEYVVAHNRLLRSDTFLQNEALTSTVCAS